MKNRSALFIVLIFISLFSLAFSPFEKEAKESVEGRKKYAVGEMAEAENEFSKAAKRLENNAEAYYDLGNALQSQQKYEDALNAYKKSLETGKTTENLRSKIFHNMGNSFAGLGKYQDAEKFYIKSLEEEPSKESAENLEIVRRIIAQQKEQQDQQKQEEQNKENQDKQENQDQNQENQEQKEEDKQNENPDDEQKDKQDQQSEKQDEENSESNDDEQSSSENNDEGETQDEENRSASAGEQDDEQNSGDKSKESSVLKQFKQRKNLQISPFMLKKEQKSDNGQTW